MRTVYCHDCGCDFDVDSTLKSSCWLCDGCEAEREEDVRLADNAKVKDYFGLIVSGVRC